MGNGYCCFHKLFCSISHEWLRIMPVLLHTTGSFKGGPKPFRFENFWTRDNTSWNVINEASNSPQTGSPAQRLLIRKIRATKFALRRWNKDCFCNIHTKIQQLRNQLDTIQQLPPSDLQYEAELATRNQLQEDMNREEMFWQKKSRIN